MIYITGDKHGVYQEVFDFCQKNKTTLSDILIILGDAGINYFLDERDELIKNKLASLPITLFCVYGNHEERPENIPSYITKKFKNGIVYYESSFPNILFAKDGEIYNFNNHNVLTIGGAYSVDKEYRLSHGYNWFPSEQPTNEIKQLVLSKTKNNKIDIILSHTCPYNYLPIESFLPGIDQFNVDHSTEYFLEELEKSTDYKHWYCGHYHIEKQIDKMVFMYHDIKLFDNFLEISNDIEI